MISCICSSLFPVIKRSEFSFHVFFCWLMVHQVLPDDMIVLAEPDPSDMVQAITKAILMLPQIDPLVMHNRVSMLQY